VEEASSESVSRSLSGPLVDKFFYCDVEQIRRELNGFDLQRKCAIIQEVWALEVVSNSDLHSISDDDADDTTDPAVDSRYSDDPNGPNRFRLS
jgi:hypothetical protein